MARTPRLRPVDLVSPWPDGEASDPVGAVAAQFVRSLEAAIGSRSVRSIAIECGLNHQTLRTILLGQVWPDMYTIARLELGLGRSLWGGALKTSCETSKGNEHGELDEQ